MGLQSALHRHLQPRDRRTDLQTSRTRAASQSTTQAKTSLSRLLCAQSRRVRIGTVPGRRLEAAETVESEGEPALWSEETGLLTEAETVAETVLGRGLEIGLETAATIAAEEVAQPRTEATGIEEVVVVTDVLMIVLGGMPGKMIVGVTAGSVRGGLAMAVGRRWLSMQCFALGLCKQLASLECKQPLKV